MKYYAAIGYEVPQHILVPILGAVDEEGGVFYTRPFDSKHHLLTLVGTVQSRMEREGREFDGACILPYGAKVPTQRTKFKVRGPLKARLDYAMPEPYQVLEMRSPYNKFYAAEQESLQHPNTVIVTPNKYYPTGLTEHNIHAYYQDNADKIIAQYNADNLDGMILMKVDGRTIMRRHASQEIMAMRVDANTFGSLNRGRTLEFHFAAGANTDFVWVDIDPKDLFPWEETKAITADLYKVMAGLDEVDVTKTELRFSGKSGFHILSYIAHPLAIDEAKMVVKKAVERYVSGRADPRIVTGTTREAEAIRIDYSTMREQGGLRVAHSLAYPTGLICTPLSVADLAGFEKDMATIAPVSVSSSEIDVVAKDKVEADLMQSLIKELKLTPDEIKQMEAELKKETPVNIGAISAQFNKKKDEFVATTEIKSVHGRIMEVVVAIQEDLEEHKARWGEFHRFVEGRGGVARNISGAVITGLGSKFKKAYTLITTIKSKLGAKSKAVTELGDIRFYWLQQIGQNKTFLGALKSLLFPEGKESTPFLKSVPKEGHLATYKKIVARGENAKDFVESALANFDQVVAILEEAEAKVPAATFIRKQEAEAVAEYPMIGDVDAESTEDLVDQINLALRQADTDLDTVNAALQDMIDDVDELEVSEPIETQGTTQEELEQFEPLRQQYNVTVDEIHAVGKWLNVFKEKLTGEDIHTILSLRDRISSPEFHNLAAKIMGRLAPDPAELDRGLMGLEMLRGLPKYQGREWSPSMLEKFVVSPDGEVVAFDTEQFPHHIHYFENFFDAEEDSINLSDLFADGWSTGSVSTDGRELTLNVADDATPEEILQKLPPKYLNVKRLYVQEKFGDKGQVDVGEGEDALSAWQNRFRPGSDVVMAKETEDFDTFMKEHKLIPYVDDIVEERRTPELADIPANVLEGISFMYDKLDPLSFQRWVEIVLGMRVPVKHLGEFVKRVEWAYSALSKKSSTGPMLGWTILSRHHWGSL